MLAAAFSKDVSGAYAYLTFPGIMSHATPALASDRTEQPSIRARNPGTNAWEIALRTAIAVAESSSEGDARPASLTVGMIGFHGPSSNPSTQETIEQQPEHDKGEG